MLISKFANLFISRAGTDVAGERMEILELAGHPYYVATQYHPEYLSRPLKPSPPFKGLILASVKKLQMYLMRGCKLSPRESDTDSDYIESGEDCWWQMGSHSVKFHLLNTIDNICYVIFVEVFCKKIPT